MTNPRFYVSLVLLAVLGAPASPAAAQQRATFVSIDQDDEQIRQADDKLREKLVEKLDEALSPSPFGYGQAINKLSEWSELQGETPYLARVTPYVYIAAEMLGAEFEIVGTYVSDATRRTTYHSYFVVNREAMKNAIGVGDKTPDLNDLRDFIRRRAEADSPAGFIYHSRFSTSSYFLPALFFRGNNIFAMPESTASLTAIDSRPIEGNSSSKLVEEVAAGRADFAAVWDGTKVKFETGERAALGRQVHFIQLPTPLPNDLLVGSPGLAKRAAEKLFPAGAGGGGKRGQLAIGIDDFQGWLDINAAAEARDALAGLRWLAREQRVPVTVRIATADDRIPPGYVEAARQAVRLAGTELVLHDDSFHRGEDYVWTLRWVREGHVNLESRIPVFEVEPPSRRRNACSPPCQLFRISFQPAEPGAEEQDLTQRIGNILASRLHRVRHVWPYDDERPLVIRDLPFSLAPGATAAVQKIRWNDPLRNAFTTFGDPRPVEVESADFFKFRLAKERFRLAMGDGQGVAPLDPMSPLAYRVLLQRPQEPQTVFHVFNVVFFALVGLSGTGTVLAFRRSRRA